MSIGTNFQFSLKSTNPPLINLDSEVITTKSFSKIYFQDSIFDFYPYGEVVLNDKMGAIIENFYFLESLEMTAKLENVDSSGFIPSLTEILTGKTTIGKLEHPFVWADNQVVNTEKENFVSGQSVFILDSEYRQKDFIKSRAWNYELGSTGALNPAGIKPNSEIARQIAIEDFNISSPLLQKISVSLGNDYQPQCNITNMEFLKRIEKETFSPINPRSPFFTFINLQGEFYFMSLFEMYLQKPSAYYSQRSDTTSSVDSFAIRDYAIMNGGASFNRDSYTRRSYKLDTLTGLIVKENLKDMNIHEYQLAPTGTDKFTIRNQYTEDLRSVDDLGICKLPQQLETFQGKVNGNYQDSDTAYRLSLVVDYNPYVVSGRTINLEFTKESKFGLFSIEFTGNWLILESKKTVSCETGRAFSNLIVSKSGINVDFNNNFLKEFFGIGT